MFFFCTTPWTNAEQAGAVRVVRPLASIELLRSFRQRLITTAPTFPEWKYGTFFYSTMSVSLLILFRINLHRLSQCQPMNETILALLKHCLVHVVCEPNFGAITQISGWAFWSSDLIFLQPLYFFLYQLSITRANF